jgi:hypothetical protein
MNDILAAKNITPENYATYRQYIDQANQAFKSTFEFEYINNTAGFNIFTIGFLLSEMLISCKFQGVTCTESDFYLFHDYNYGNCYRFNGGSSLSNQSFSYHKFSSYDLKKTTKTGWENGLQLELYTGNQGVQQQYTYKTGVRVIIHNVSIVTFTDIDGIDVAVGSQTNVAVSRTFMYRLGTPYSDCIDDLNEEVANENSILEMMYEQKQTNLISQYQQDYCLQMCYQIYIISQCNCTDMSLYFLNVSTSSSYNITGCVSTANLNCLSNADQTFYNGDQVDQCYSYCPVECNQIVYDTQVSTADVSLFNLIFKL